MSLRRDAVPDDARGSPCSPYRPVAVEHVRQIGTRESSWTWHHVGGRRADHGRKREPGDGHIPNRPFSGPEDVQVEQPRPAAGMASRRSPTRLRLCNTPQAPRLVTENRAGTVRLSKIVLDGKRPITEGLPVLPPSLSSMRAAVITPAEPTGARVARSSAGGSLPRYSGGSASAMPVSRPARRSLALRPTWSLSRPGRPVAPECFSRSRYLLQPLRLLPAGATAAGRVSKPAEGERLSTAHGIKRVREFAFWLIFTESRVGSVNDSYGA